MNYLYGYIVFCYTVVLLLQAGAIATNENAKVNLKTIFVLAIAPVFLPTALIVSIIEAIKGK